ncbi:MAG: Maf family nucleotide pyrophosphatase [Bacteroidia bacterium]
MINFKYNLILGSKSPRRREILSMAGLNFETVDIDVQEDYPKTLLPHEIAEYLAVKKSNGFTLRNKNDLLITSDTIVVKNNKVLEKPANADKAFEMLKELNGAVHYVYTGVCLRSMDKQIQFTDKTEVSFLEMKDEELRYYIQTCKPFDKAGAYGVQEWMGMVAVDNINGTFYNVMGLPIHKLYSELKEF